MKIWMWRFGRGSGHRAQMVSIAEAENIRAERLGESRIRAAETKKRRSKAGRPGQQLSLSEPPGIL